MVISSNYPNVTEIVHKDLREKIINGEFRLGSKLKEGDLENKFGVSKTPIKIALAKLEQTGLVITIPRKGTHVISMTSDLAREIYSLREVLEGLAVKVATQNCSKANIEELHKIIAEMSEEAKNPETESDLKKYIELDKSFHSLILKFSKHRLLGQSLDALHDMIALFQFQNVSLSGWKKKSYEEHFTIFEALRRGDAAGAEKAMRFHILRAMDFLMHNFNEAGDSC